VAGFFARNGPLAQDWTDYFSEFDIIVSYLYDPDQIFQTNIHRCSPAQFIAGPHRPGESSPIHAAKVYLKPLERLAIFEADPVPRLNVLADRDKIATPVADLSASFRLALHPGSGSDRKNWPEQRWAQLVQALINSTAFNLLLVGGEAEGERLQRLATALPLQRTEVAQSLPLADLARVLANCGGFIGHDSGISHLAAAVGLPALLLWGETQESIWRPPAESVKTLRGSNGLESLPVDTVFDQLCRLWPAGTR
jgi:heptosyltransferase-2